jgi:hypothetical protein
LTIIFRYVLDQVLSGEATETVVELIHEYLTTIGGNVREGKIKMDEFIVFKVSPFYLVASRFQLTSHSDWGKTQKIIPTARANLMYK